MKATKLIALASIYHFGKDSCTPLQCIALALQANMCRKDVLIFFIVCVLFCVWECFYICHMSFFLPGNVMLCIYLKKRETNAWLCKHWGINSARAQNVSKLTQRLFFTQCAQIQICTRIMTHVRQRSGRKRIR